IAPAPRMPGSKRGETPVSRRHSPRQFPLRPYTGRRASRAAPRGGVISAGNCPENRVRYSQRNVTQLLERLVFLLNESMSDSEDSVPDEVLTLLLRAGTEGSPACPTSASWN